MLGIFTHEVSLGYWDPESIKSGLPGSEESVVYMSQKLAQLGYKVLVFGNPPLGSIHSLPEANPRYVNFDFNDGSLLDIAVVWRKAERGEEIRKRARKVYLWPHDICSTRLTNEQINSFDDILWLSQWQQRQWVLVNPGLAKFTKIFGNGIDPDQFEPVRERLNPYSCIYGSNYARGLEILINIWPAIKASFPQATLDTYYGWQHWGMMSPAQEKRLRAKMINASFLGVRDHGSVSHEELNKAYGKASFWTYPCIAPETFCITALRAQLAGAIPVVLANTALRETVRYGYRCFKPEDYLRTLIMAMRDAEKLSLADREIMGRFVLQEFTWQVIAERWKKLFDS